MQLALNLIESFYKLTLCIQQVIFKSKRSNGLVYTIYYIKIWIHQKIVSLQCTITIYIYAYQQNIHKNNIYAMTNQQNKHLCISRWPVFSLSSTATNPSVVEAEWRTTEQPSRRWLIWTAGIRCGCWRLTNMAHGAVDKKWRRRMSAVRLGNSKEA
jgi:hypothetical protein